MTAELVEFLLACIAEDEQQARAAHPGGWSVREVVETYSDGSTHAFWGLDSSVAVGEFADTDVVRISYDRDYGTPEDAIDTRPSADHIAAWDPARVLAECDVKRQVVNVYRALAVRQEADRVGSVQWHEAKAYETVLSQLGQVYSDRPGYRQEWTP